MGAIYYIMNIGEKLKRLKTEDLIWVIYFFIVIGALMSNEYERNYLLTGNTTGQKKFKLINITIFCVAFIIYLYFVLINYEDVQTLKRDATRKEVLNVHIGLISSILFLVAGALAIVGEINRGGPDEDIGFI